MNLNKELNLAKNILKPSILLKSGRDGFGEALLALGKENEDIVALSADLKDSTKVGAFAKAFPKRFFEIGVAEQNMAGIAAGLALSGKTPFFTSFGVFSPGRNWDQFRVSVCYSNANAKMASSHLGLGNGPDGATHQALEDIALTRVLPNLVVLSPADYEQTKKVVMAAANYVGPVYIRYARPEIPVFTTETTPFEIGKAYVVAEGTDVTLCATGPSVYEALEAADKALKDYNISCEVINIPTIKPLDAKTIIASAKKTGKVITVEEHQVYGGMGSAVAEVLSQNHPTKMKIMGVQDTFTESGTYIQLKDKYKVSSNHILKEILNFK